jgi:hypothetical protein
LFGQIHGFAYFSRHFSAKIQIPHDRIFVAEVAKLREFGVSISPNSGEFGYINPNREKRKVAALRHASTRDIRSVIPQWWHIQVLTLHYLGGMN